MQLDASDVHSDAFDEPSDVQSDVQSDVRYDVCAGELHKQNRILSALCSGPCGVVGACHPRTASNADTVLVNEFDWQSET